MKEHETYWFTVAVGDAYVAKAADLVASAGLHGIHVHVLSDAATEHDAKLLKIRGMRNTHTGTDRVAYLDADTLLVSPQDVHLVNGSLKEPWGMGDCRGVGNPTKQAKLDRVVRLARLEEFLPGGQHRDQEWNSGVIIGDTGFMIDLATAWLDWWGVVLDVCDGEFVRDQISYRLAYSQVARQQYGYESLPVEWNCSVRRSGFLPNAHVLHNSGKFGPNIDAKWDAARRQVLEGTYRGLD